MNTYVLTECINEMEAFLDDAAEKAASHKGPYLVVDGSMYSPADRALPGASTVWESSDMEAWETFEFRVDDKMSEYGMYYEDGVMWLEQSK